MRDLIGDALLDYYEGRYSEDLITWTNLTEEDPLPLPYLFRPFEEMPLIEQVALNQAKGKVLDIGCGAGSHSLYLQKQGHEVLGIDISKGAIEVCQKRGIHRTQEIDILALNGEKFDTILLLMNGTGIFKDLQQIPTYLKHLKSLLQKGGQILIDSTDLIYMYEDQEDGSILIPTDHYYGEVKFWMSYKGIVSEAFDWLYLHEDILEEYCKAEDLQLEVLARGENFDYLARLSIIEEK